MAYIAAVKILVDESNESTVYDGINEMLRSAQYGGPNGEDRGWVVDWKFESVDPANESLNDSIAKETYEEGDVFRDWVIFSRSEAIAQDGAGFWSNEYGWTTLDLATKFKGAQRAVEEYFFELPHSAGMDATWMLAPYRMNFYRLMLVESPGDATLDQTPIAFECFAEDYGHAVKQAESAYPGCRVIGTEGGDHEYKCEPTFEPFKLVVEAYATDEFGEGPSWAEMTVTPEFLQTLERLRRVCQDENLESVTIPQGPDRWDLEDDLRIRGDSLRVWRDDFWFEAHPKHSDYSVETRSILIDHLIRVARKIADDDVENPLPDGFAIRNGIVFYGESDPENLADSYFEEAKDESAATVCGECGAHTDYIIGCPDGAEICQACFDNGAH